MSKASEVRHVFRVINDGLIKIETSPGPEAVRVVQSLKTINEEMCDHVVDLLRSYERIKIQLNESRKRISEISGES
jgi:hypothetical protein